MLQSKAGYIDARPLTASSAKPLATHGRTIHWVSKACGTTAPKPARFHTFELSLIFNFTVAGFELFTF
jgi:hypothetical protein